MIHCEDCALAAKTYCFRIAGLEKRDFERFSQWLFPGSRIEHWPH
jgi:hypothetical protein